MAYIQQQQYPPPLYYGNPVPAQPYPVVQYAQPMQQMQPYYAPQQPPQYYAPPVAPAPAYVPSPQPPSARNAPKGRKLDVINNAPDAAPVDAGFGRMKLASSELLEVVDVITDGVFVVELVRLGGGTGESNGGGLLMIGETDLEVYIRWSLFFFIVSLVFHLYRFRLAIKEKAFESMPFFSFFVLLHADKQTLNRAGIANAADSMLMKFVEDVPQLIVAVSVSRTLGTMSWQSVAVTIVSVASMFLFFNQFAGRLGERFHSMMWRLLVAGILSLSTLVFLTWNVFIGALFCFMTYFMSMATCF